MRPETLALRATNQYRRRDTLAYLGLRYYLENQCARRDRWSNEIATHITRSRVSTPYFSSYHFKELCDETGDVLHRPIAIPSPTEMYAEAALINHCSLHSTFRARSCVYSYRLPTNTSNDGVFENYFKGFQDRHKSLAEACRAEDVDAVLYTDIKKFYPSITVELAQKTWRQYCKKAQLENTWIELGEKILHDHGATSAKTGGNGILTGPVFSHLIANLVMDDVDQKMEDRFPNRYWRYVDDVVIAGRSQDIRNGREYLASLLGDLGLELHTGDKDFEISHTQWLEGENDFENGDGLLWMELVSNVKRFLMWEPKKKDVLRTAFAEVGIRLPLLDYAIAVADSTYLERSYDWLRKYRWAKKSVRQITVSSLVELGLKARDKYIFELDLQLKNIPSSGFGRKRAIPKLRYYSGRLIYLLPNAPLRTMTTHLEPHPELYLMSQVARSIADRDVTQLFSLGTNAVQSAVQILRIDDAPVTCSLERFDTVHSQGAAIMAMNGLVMKNTLDNRQPINDFAEWTNGKELMKSEDHFVQELACLHGINPNAQHGRMLDTAFDRNEQLAFDVITQLQESSYF